MSKSKKITDVKSGNEVISPLDTLVMLKFAEEIRKYITETARYIPHADTKQNCTGCKFAKRRDKILKQLSKFST